MKKKSLIVLFIGLFFSYAALAAKPDCNEFIITIQNHTSYDCTLKSSKILTGELFENSKIPNVIFRGQKETFLMSRNLRSARYHGLHGTSLYLRYQCGEHQEVSLLSYLPGYLVSSYFAPPKVIGSVLDSQHLTVSSTQTDPRECSALFSIAPAELAWTLQDEMD